MAISLPAIVARISLDDRELEAGSRKLSGVGKAVAAGLAVAGAAAATVAVKGAQAAMEVDKGLREVLTLNSGLKAGSNEAAAALDGLKGDVRALSDEIGIAQSELVDGLYSTLSAGIPEDNAFAFLETAGKLAIAGVTDVETAVDGMSTAINAYGLDAADADKVAAALFTGMQDGKTTVEELSSSLFQVAPAASAAGISLEESVAAVSALAGQGVPTSVATTQIRSAINELNDDSSKVSETFQELTGKTFREFTAAGGTLEEALGLLGDQADDTGGVISDYFGSVEAGAAATTLAGNAADAFAQNVQNQAAASEDAAGVIDNAYQMIDQSASRSWDRAKIAGQNALIEVGEAVAPVAATLAENLVPAIGRATDAFSATVEFVETHGPRIASTVRNIALVVGTVLLPVLARMVAQQTVAFVQGAVQAARAAVTHYAASVRIVAGWAMQAAASVRSAASVAHTFGLLIAHGARAAASHAANAARIVAGWVVQGAAATVQGARMAAGWVVGIIVPAATAAATMVAQAARVVGGWVLMGVQSLANAARMAAAWLIAMGPIGLVIAAVVGLVALIVANWSTIVEWTKALGERVGGFLSSMRDRAVGIFTNLRDRVVGFVGGMRDRVVAAAGALRDRAVAAVTGLRDRAVAAVTGLRDRAVTTAGALRDRVVSAVTGLRDRAVSIVTGLRDRVASAFGEARDRAASAATDARQRVVTAITQLRDNVRERIDSVVAFFTDLPGKIVSALSSAATQLARVGREMITGLIGGLREMGARAVDAAKGVVKGAIDGAKSLLGIRSPSRVFAAIGKDTGAGMVVGLRSMAGEVQRAADRALVPDVDPVELGTPVVPPSVAAARRGDTPAALVARLRSDLERYADRPLDATFDLGDGITARYRIERTREGRARAVRLQGAR